MDATTFAALQLHHHHRAELDRTIALRRAHAERRAATAPPSATSDHTEYALAGPSA